MDKKGNLMDGLVLLLFVMLIISTLALFRRTLRRKAAVVAVVSFLGLGVTGHFMHREAEALGFRSYSALSEARRAGITDPAEWRLREEKLAADVVARAEVERARLAAEAAAKQAAEAAARDAELAAAETRAAAERERERACRSDLRCWAEKSVGSATIYCREAVERLALNNFEWFDGWTEPKFSHFRWGNQASGTVTFAGDKIKFQNGFGAWIIHTYDCEYDPVQKRVVGARARPGRLPSN